MVADRGTIPRTFVTDMLARSNAKWIASKMVFHNEKADSAAWLLVQELFESSVRIRWGRCKTARSQSTCGYDRRPGDDHEEHHESSTGVAQYTEGRPLSMTLSMLREYERRDGAGAPDTLSPFFFAIPSFLLNPLPITLSSSARSMSEVS